MNLLERTQDRFRRALRWQGFWWVTAMAGVLIVGSILSWLFWGDLKGKNESLSTAIRNVGLVIGGIEAMLLAAWRSTVAGRQAVTAERQAETALRQSETAQQGLLNERYQKGAEMLGNEVLAVRLGGIHALQRLAKENPEQYHIQIMELFCAFIRFPTDDKMMASSRVIEQQDRHNQTLRPDVQDAMRFLAARPRNVVIGTLG